MLERTSYPAGVPCWVDLMQPDLDRTMAFYGELFGWTFEVRTPPSAPQRYAYARLDGLIVGGVGEPSAAGTDPSGWTSYISVDSADATVAAIEANGGRVLNPPVDIPRSGRPALAADPSGAVFGIWEPNELHGSEVVNDAGSWNFSELHASDQAAAMAFYGAVFGWECEPMEMGAQQPTSIWRVPGYGKFLAERDPELEARLEANDAPGGFADAVALLSPVGPGDGATAGWDVIFAVADADASFALAIELGATVVTPLFDTDYTRMGVIADPQGAVLTLSQYRPPAG